VRVRVTAREGEPLTAGWAAPDAAVTVTSPQPLGRAQNRAVNLEAVRAQFERLGGTPYELAGVELEVSGSPFVPSSLLNQLRRQAVELLQEAQGRPRATAVSDDPGDAVARAMAGIRPAPEPGPPQLHLLVRTPEQLEAALALAPASITLDYLDLYRLRPSVERVKSAGTAVRVASPRVLKPGEERIADFLLRLECPVVVRAAGLLHYFRQKPHPELIGDFSLNAANAVSADLLLHLGVARVTPTHDLNAAQVAELARSLGPAHIEAIAYQHLPVFHTEHCVFCRFLSNGTSYRDCGRPCESHRVSVRDVSGRAHPVMADVGCRNTVFGARRRRPARTSTFGGMPESGTSGWSSRTNRRNR
jgi:putative protease